MLRERAGEDRYMGNETYRSRDISAKQRSNIIKIEKTVKGSKKGDNEK